LRKSKKLRIYPIRVNFSGELPYDLAAYLDPIQYITWCPTQSFEPIHEGILREILDPEDSAAAAPHDARPEDLWALARITELNGAPMPTADPRLDTGAVGLDSPFYVIRPEDNQLAQLVRQHGITALLKGPRQVGKTSLLARAQAEARHDGQRTLYLDLQLVDESHFGSLRAILLYFAHRIARDLRSLINPTELWDEALGAPDSLTDFLEAVLQDASLRVCLALDEADRVFQYKFRNAFFAMLRAWHNRRATNPVWNRLNLLIGHSTEPALFIEDINQSPFNVGEIFRLGDFSALQVQWLNQAHAYPLSDVRQIDELMRLVGGHPYLVRQALYSLRTRFESLGSQKLTALKQVAATDSGPFGDHLRRHLWVLRDREILRQELRRVVRGSICESEDCFQRLRAGGLLDGESREDSRFRCDLYRQYFATHL